MIKFKSIMDKKNNLSNTLKQKNMFNKGITLIALVITIIILLILVGISIGLLKKSGLIEKAKLAKEESENAQKLENAKLREYESEIEKYINGTNNNIINSECNHISNIITDFKPIVTFNNGIYLEVTNNAETTNESDIFLFIYILNGKVYKQTQEKNVMLENLEMDKDYELQILAIDEEAKIKYSSNLKVKTESKVYLYKKGNEITYLTGGWTGTSTAGYGTSNGAYDKRSNNLYVKNTSTKSWENSNFYPAWVTNNAIDVAKFSKIVYEGDFIGDEQNVGCKAMLAVNQPYGGGNYYDTDLTFFKRVQTIELILDNVDKNNRYFVSLSAQNSNGNFHSEATIENVWLEKY